MGKKLLSVIVAMSLVIVATASYPLQNVYAEEAAETAEMLEEAENINPDDLLAVLDDITLAGEAWESIGFDSGDIAEIAQMERKDASYYAEINDQIAALSIETDQTRSLEADLLNKAYAVPYAQDGNPPESPQEQNERISYVAQVASNRYGLKDDSLDFNKYVLYLYMSHYIDNPYYSKDDPSFDKIYAYVITSDDIRAYESFIDQSKFAMFAGNFVNFLNEFKTAAEDIYNLQDSVRNSKIISFNTAKALYDLEESDKSDMDMAQRAYLVATSFKNHYESTDSVKELLDAIYMDLEPEDVSKQYIDTCAIGILGLLVSSTTLFSFGLSISLCYFNIYMNLFDKVRLVALHYTLSLRVAGRLTELIW